MKTSIKPECTTCTYKTKNEHEQHTSKFGYWHYKMFCMVFTHQWDWHYQYAYET